MTDLRWSWLGAPYFGCAAVVLAVAVAAVLIRGDRVLRLGMIAAAATALPWAVCQGLAACTDDVVFATHLLRVGNGTTALVGPNLLLVLLGVSGQLDRQRWIARIAGIVGLIFLIAAWATDWTVPGVQRVPAGMFYTAVGPLTAIHLSLLVVWLALGLWIVQRSSPSGEQARAMRLVLGVLACGAIASVDVLLLYGVWGVYPIAWLPASVAAGIALYLCVRTDMLRPQGLDRAAAAELVGFAGASVVIALCALTDLGSSPLAISAVAAAAWTGATAVAWRVGRLRPVRVEGSRELEQLVARVATLDDEAKIAELLAALWQRALGVGVRATWWRDGEALARIGGRERWEPPPEAVAWLVRNPDALAPRELATMRLGALRGPLEALAAAHGASVIVPLVDRDELVGLGEADYDRALRETERATIAESAQAAARALTFVQLARAAARERDTAREVEIADALRLQATVSRAAVLGGWAVAGEYRTAPRTTGAGWSAIELADGRLALLVTEAQAHGVAAALATAALTGAFSAATVATIGLDDLLRDLRATADGVMRGGEPVAAFVAILDARARTLDWACAGHPGALLVGPVAAIDPDVPEGSSKGRRPTVTPVGSGTRAPGASLAVATRGQAPLPDDTLLVVASSGLRGDDDARWQRVVGDRAPATARLAALLVEHALAAGEPHEDLLAVVVRPR